MQLGLSARKAVVTGGTKGIGRAVVSELLAEGASVAFCARHSEEVRQAEVQFREESGNESGPSVQVFGCTADVASSEEVPGFIDEAAAGLGGIDILVNNAGAASPGDFETLTDTDWHRDLDVKLFAQIRCIRAALPYLRRSSAARVININAVFGKYPDPAFFATSVNRAACLNLTKALAQELGPESILVNSVNIGFVATPQWENIRHRKAPEQGEEEFFSRLASAEVPLGRFGRADEVAGVVAFLASDRASYITGAMVDVAGGMGKYV